MKAVGVHPSHGQFQQLLSFNRNFKLTIFNKENKLHKKTEEFFEYKKNRLTVNRGKY